MAEATAPKKAKDKKPDAYVVIGTDGTVIVEPSEIRALRTAVATGGKSKAIEFGKVINPAMPQADTVSPTVAPETY